MLSNSFVKKSASNARLLPLDAIAQNPIIGKNCFDNCKKLSSKAKRILEEKRKSTKVYARFGKEIGY